MKGVWWSIVWLWVSVIFLSIASIVNTKLARSANDTPNANLALEARVTVLEGQVKELRRVVGIDKGLKEGLQNRGKK